MNLANKLQELVVKFCDNLSFKELRDLAIYLGAEVSQKTKPSKIQQKFCEEFIGKVRFAEYLQNANIYFSNDKIIGSEIAELYSFVSFQCILRSSELLLENGELKLKELKLKKDLAEAVIASFEGDIFYKVEGWCNISEVLEKYKLISLEE